MRLEPEEVAAIADAVAARLSGSLSERLEAITTRVDRLAQAALASPVTLTDIARELGRHVEWVRTHRWAQPDFGVADLPGIPKSWFRPTWDAWKRELQQYHDEWSALTPARQLARLREIEIAKRSKTAVRRLEIVREGGRGQPA